MLTLFKSNKLVTVFLLLTSSVLLNLHLYFEPLQEFVEPAYSPLIHLIQNVTGSFNDWTPWFYYTTFILIIYIQGLWINIYVNKHKLLGDNGFVPAYLFVLIYSIIPGIQEINGSLIANFLIIPIVGQICSMYKVKSVSPQLFNTGILCALAIYAYPPYILLVVSIPILNLLVRSINLKETAIMLGGVICTSFIIVGTSYLLETFTSLSYGFQYDFNQYLYIGLTKLQNIWTWSLLSLLFVLSGLYYLVNRFHFRTLSRKIASFFIILMGINIASFWFYPVVHLEHFTPLFLLTIFLTSLYFQNSKRVLMLEIFNLLIVGGFVYLKFWQHL